MVFGVVFDLIGGMSAKLDTSRAIPCRLLHVKDSFNDLHHCGMYRNLPVMFVASP